MPYEVIMKHIASWAAQILMASGAAPIPVILISGRLTKIESGQMERKNGDR